jgi:phosphate:Na+ symporter
MVSTDLWKIFAGLGLFLYGMFHLEDSIKAMEGRSFKLFLQKHTKKKLSAILSGTFVTAILQSSSIVNLIVLSFVGAGMLSMRNALGVAMGANIGGTFNSWLVALLGFKIELNAYTLPIIAICGLGLIVFKSQKRLQLFLRLGMGIGLLFLGLDYMKSSMEASITNFDFKPYLDQPRFVFVVIGFVITALIQTSAATVVLALSGLYTHLIPIETAVAVVLGAELGTTLKLFIGSIGGIAAKKRVAVGNILFNIFTSACGYIFLSPIIYFLSEFIKLSDPIYILVAFQSFINISGVILIYFFLDGFSNFLEKRYIEKQLSATYFLETTSPEIKDTAVEMLEKEVGLFIYRIMNLNLEMFHISAEGEGEGENDLDLILKNKTLEPSDGSYKEKYNLLKQAEGEILTFYSQLSDTEAEGNYRLRLNQLMASLRNAMYSAKGMKDIYEDIMNLSNSSNDIKYYTYQLIQMQHKKFYLGLYPLLLRASRQNCFENLVDSLNLLKHEYEERLKNSLKIAGEQDLKELDISTLFNLNRELYTSSKSMIFSLKDYLLDRQSAEHFENLPIGV